ncbi:hypothetical protein FOMPIDRAFT_46194 [Fomitopsis schrenkii]|uniref:Reverse transcriptase domain-containing protein n=1 Tax=Fomitopsis schrenkii TaxID=2126942 RepID=S8E553_FOMSC|nr:hypothetical protein FOMPIDRAFT_46194 [Fomitopsis schrenkii]
MHKLGIPAVIVDWLQRKLQGRRTQLCFDDFVSQLFKIVSRINQGCPLLVILYKIYNLLLLDCANLLKHTKPVVYIDDVAAVAVGKTLHDTTAELSNYMTHPGSALDWLHSSNSLFNVPKLALMHFDPRLIAGNLGPDLALLAGAVKPSAKVPWSTS